MSKKTIYSILYKLGTSENYKSLVRKDFLCMDYFYLYSTFGRYTFFFWYVLRCHMFYYRWSIRSNSSTLSRQKITLYIYAGIYIPFMYYLSQKYHDIYNMITWTSLFITLFSYIWWSSPSAMLYIYNILPSIGGVLILIRVVIIFFGYSCWHVT